MTIITHEYMREMISQTRQYCVVILRATPKSREEGADKIVCLMARHEIWHPGLAGISTTRICLAVSYPA